MKYIVITAKHHDGFAMFDSKANPFNIVAATPFHRDPLRELADEAPQAGHQARLLLLARSGLDRARRIRDPARQPRPRHPSLGPGAGRRLRHLSPHQGHPADQGTADELRRLPRRPLVRHAHRQHDARARRRDCRPAQPAPQPHLEQPPRRRIQGRHRNAGAVHSRRRAFPAATGSPA